MSLLEAFSNEQASILRAHVRPAFTPNVEQGEAKGPVSKIAGAPWLPDGVDWPVCPNCQHPMQLLVQIDLESLPPGAPECGPGLAQLFYCLSSEPLCEVDCEAYAPFARSVVARVVDKRSPGSDAEPRGVPNALEPKRIVGWARRDDLPNPEELRDRGVDVQYGDDLYHALHDAKVPLDGDKLGGWPYWVQSVEYPACPDCGRTMELVFQIDSGDQVGWQWGDTGCAHLTQCPLHRQRLAFAWACC